MRFDRLRLTAVLCLILTTGCVNTQGERVSMRQWWQGPTATQEPEARDQDQTANAEQATSQPAEEEPADQVAEGPAREIGRAHV